MDKNSKVQKLEDLVRYGKTTSFSVYKLAMFYKDNGLVFLDNLIYEKYDRLIMSMCSRVKFSDEEYSLYRMNPDRLSIDLYGTPALAHLILYINRCNVVDFRKRNLQLIAPSHIEVIFQKIIAHEQKNIDKNHNSNL